MSNDPDKDAFEHLMPRTPLSSNAGSWKEWARYILETLRSLDRRIVSLRTDMGGGDAEGRDDMAACKGRCDAALHALQASIVEIRIELAVLKVKAGVWGLIGASIPVVAAAIVFLLQKNIAH